MEVELRYFGTVRRAVGTKTERRDVEAGTTVRDVLAALEGEHPDLVLLEDGEVAPSVTVMVNGRNVVHLDGAETELEAGDRVSVTPPVTGG